MPVIINKNGTDYYLVPAPLVSFSKNITNNVGRPGIGADYSLTLQGKLIQTHGNPYYASGIAGLSTSSWTTTSTVESNEITDVDGEDRLDATIKKQEKIRSLFSNPVVSGVAKPIKMTIKGWDTNYDGSGIQVQAFVDNITFDSDGNWANPGSYTISLRNATFLTSANSGEFSANNDEHETPYRISSLSESFDVQEESQKTITFNDTYNFDHVNKVYTVNRAVNAVGAPNYDSNGSYVSGLAPWQQASGYIYSYLGLGSGQIPLIKTKAVGLLGTKYNSASVLYQESVDKEGGSYSLNETYLLYSGVSPVIETITINEDINESELKTVTVQGTIQGLNTISGFETSGNAYANADVYFSGISTGVPPLAYYYALNTTNSSWLHPRQLTRSVSRDFAAGTIAYSYSFDSRPPNIIPGSISESISINDTYPGEIISITPVIGRSQPVIQYLNSRSEYKRSLSITAVMGAMTQNWSSSGVNSSGVLTSSAQSVVQGWLLSQKPSITNSGELNTIYQAANPANDPNFTIANGKCFHLAPNESWDARTRNYTYNVEWVYERT